MGQTALADFVGTFDAETVSWDDYRKGRVLLNDRQLILAASREETESVPLDTIFDIRLDTTPRAFDPPTDRPLTVAYEMSGKRAVAVVTAEESTIEKFSTILFKAVLNGTRVSVKHPARRGGRVTDSTFETGKLTLEQGGVTFKTNTQRVTIEPSAVTSFDRDRRTVAGRDRPVFVVRHMQDGTALTTLAATESARSLSILGRYLRRHYDELMASLRDVSLSETEIETLVTIYSTEGTSASLSNVVSEEPAAMKRLLHSLNEKALVRPGDTGPELTTKGQVVVNHYLEHVNA